MARRPVRPATHAAVQGERQGSRFDVLIAIALGLAAIVTAASVYLNEHQEHSAELDFHQATHELIGATAAGSRTPAGP